MLKHPAVPYVLPFAVFMLLLVVGPRLPLPGGLEYPLRVAVLAAVLWVFSRKAIDLQLAAPVASIGLGVAVFLLWIGPDLLIPGYRQHWLFQNSITGKLQSSIPSALLLSPMVLVFRSIRAIILVPIIEELFWRGWLMRWWIDRDFLRVPLGSYQTQAFWVTAALFASEHGPYWEVGLLTGIIYNWWMVRTRRLGDLFLAHAVTNACLSMYVLNSGKWEYWL
jgi:hypothetical protein